MKIVFLSLRAKEPLAYGLLSLTGALRQHGHHVELVYADNAAAAARDRAVAAADVIGMSATTGLHRVYVSWTRQLRASFPDKALILGGPHPTFHPQVIEQAPFDGVCVGEGEESLPEFLDLYAAGFPEVPAGWWIREDHGRGPVRAGDLRPPPRDLDALAKPAYDLYYDNEPKHRNLPIRVFLSRRGCPHKCTYCFNRVLNERYRPFGPVVRRHDPEGLVDDIVEVRRRWGGKLVWFLDPNFVTSRKWLEAFLPIYERRVGLPFFCKLRPERAAKERIVRLLAAGGCTGVGIGLETGSEQLRREVLGRNVSDRAILRGCAQLKAFGIRIMSFNMLGIPGETLDDALRTVALNVACKVDYAGATILQPYPGTRIAELAQARGDFDGDFDKLSYSYFAESPLRFPSQRDRDRITNLQRVFSFAVEFPEVRSRLRRIIDRPPRSLTQFLFLGRHNWALHHTFYRAFRRGKPVLAGRSDQLAAALAELGVD